MEDYVKIKAYYYDEEDQPWIESMWAKPYEGNYILENSPFYVESYAYQDIVKGKIIDGELFIDCLVKESGHSNIQVAFFDPALVQNIRDEFNALGCSSELCKGSYIALDVPKEVDYFGTIKPLLEKYAALEILDYGEACLAHTN